MRTIAIFIDDASTAQRAIQPLLDAADPARLLIVACAPKMTHRIGKWLNHASREQWRQRWAQQVFAQLQPLWSGAPRGVVETSVAKGPLPRVLSRLQQQFGSELEALDARRVVLGRSNEPLTARPVPEARRWAVPVAITSGISLALALTD